MVDDMRIKKPPVGRTRGLARCNRAIVVATFPAQKQKGRNCVRQAA